MNDITRQIALDARVSEEEYAGRQSELNLLRKTNPYQSFAHDGYGVNLAPVEQKHDIFVAKDRAEYERAVMAMDDAAFSIPSSGVLPYFTTIFNKNPIKQILKTTPSRKVTEDWQQGMFGTTDVKIPTLSFLGNSELYNDFGGQGGSSVNYNWVPRQTVTLQRTLKYGDMTVAQNAMAKLDYVGNMREGLVALSNLDINYINLFGFSGRNTFGLSNDPSLNAVIPFPNNAANTSSLWANKTFDEIMEDIRSLWNELVTQAGGNVDMTAKAYFLIPPSAYAYTTTQNSFGLTVLEQCAVQFPNMEFVQCAQYQGTGTPPGTDTDSICQLILDELNGQRVAYNIFSSLYNSHGVVRGVSFYEEKISYTVAGGFLALPVGVATGSGL